jgi:AraC-like DNA-binding protein
MHIGKSGYTYIAEIITNETRISRIDIKCDEHEILGELLDVDVIALCETNDGLWLGTNSGLYRLCEGKFTSYTIDDGLSCNIVTCIKESEDGVLWIGTEGGGVCCFDGKVFQVIQIPGDIGLNVIHDIMVTDSMVLWFATELGLVQYQRDKSKPTVKIEVVEGDVSYRGRRIPQFPNTITSLVFHFKGNSTGEILQDIVYRYRLIGATLRWKQTRDEKVTYDSLSPGHYTFEVQALNRDLNYSDIAKRRIIITPDPWIAALVSDSSSDLYTADNRLYVGKVLLLDRDQNFLEYCSRFLRRVGYKVSTRSYSVDIVDELQRYDAVLITLDDFLKSSSDSKKMSRKIGAKCVVITDFSQIKTVDDVIRCGAFSYIAKPFEAYQLVDKIWQVIYRQKDELLLYIRNHLGSVYTREDVADTLDISPNTVSNRVRRSCGMGFSEFLQMCRVQEAQKLLVQTSLHIHQVANNVGLESHEGLTRTFKKHTGYTPKQYRNKMRSVQL